MEWLKDLLIAIGGGTTALVVALTVCKSIFIKLFDRTIDITFDKTIEKYRNKLVRTTTAYEILLSKEFTYYSTLDPHLATLVPLVFDLVYYANCSNDKIDKSTRRERYKEQLFEYIGIIPQIKNDVVLYQPYIPQEVFSSVSSLIWKMQSEAEFWANIAETLFEANDNPINIKKAEEIRDNILERIAEIETNIKKRLTELSET